MELHPTTFPESLKATLNCYQLTSIDSLSGPSGYPALAAQMWFKENKQLPPIPTQPLLPIPYLMQNDKTIKRSETILGGEKIACFIVGGEKRLCLPQILTSVLREYSIAEINQACAELHIYCSRCLPEQLEILKVLAILPINTAQCGLITKTDAERLVALLIDQHEPVKSMRDRMPKDVNPDSGFHVYHECFGRGYGKFFPELYVSPVSSCIICEDCGCLYSPQRFIAHSHRSFEKRTCHWGFDPENWRNYLLLPKNLEDAKREELEKVLDQMKLRFEPPRYEIPASSAPRRYSSTASSPPTPVKRRYDSEQESPIRKKIKEENSKIFESNLLPHPYASLPYGVPAAMRHSAFRPWSPGLSGMGGLNPSDIPVIQDLSHLKGLLPLGFDRRGFAQYLQNGRPVIMASRPTEFSLPPHADSRPRPDLRTTLPEEIKRVQENRKFELPPQKSPLRDNLSEKDRNNNYQEAIPIRMSGRVIPKEEARKLSTDRSHGEKPRKLSISPSRPQNAADVSPRSRAGITPTRYIERVVPPISQPSAPFLPTRSTTSSLSSNNNNALREPREEYEIARPISRSRAAAATAMLELKAAGSFRVSGPPISRMSALSPPSVPALISVPGSSETKLDSWKVSTIVPTTKPSSSLPNVPSGSVVLPLDSSRQNYKWTIGGHSYIVSAAGFQSLDILRSLLESECAKSVGKDRIMHELVKMKSLFEEKIDIEMREKRDLEMELEHAKATQREKRQASSEARQLIRQDIEMMRQEHNKRLEELTRSRDFLEKQLENAKRGMNSEESRGSSPALQEMKDMRLRIQELEAKNDKLRMSLMEERERREKAERKLEDAAESSRGRISFLMESPLSRMVRGVGRRNHEEESGKSPHSPRPFQPPIKLNKKATSSQVNSFPSTSTLASHCQLNGSLPTSAISVNGQITVVHGKSTSAGMDSPKTVTVS